MPTICLRVRTWTRKLKNWFVLSLSSKLVVINRDAETRGLAADDRTRRVYYRKAWSLVPRCPSYEFLEMFSSGFQERLL